MHLSNQLETLLAKASQALQETSQSINSVDSQSDNNVVQIATLTNQIQQVLDLLSGITNINEFLSDQDIISDLDTPAPPENNKLVQASTVWQINKELESLLDTLAAFDGDADGVDYVENLNSVMTWARANKDILDAMAPATPTQTGFFSKEDKAKLDALEQGATATNLSDDETTNDSATAASTALTFKLKTALDDLAQTVSDIQANGGGGGGGGSITDADGAAIESALDARYNSTAWRDGLSEWTNTLPTIVDINQTTKATQDLIINLDNYGSDPDEGQTLTYTCSPMTNVTLAGSILTFNSPNVGTEVFTITTDDGAGGGASATLTITVTRFGYVEIVDKTEYAVQGIAKVITLGPTHDDENDQAVYTVTGSTDFVMGPGTNEITFTGTTVASVPLSVQADDGNGNISNATITVEVEAPSTNPWPVVQNVSPQYVAKGATFSLTPVITNPATAGEVNWFKEFGPDDLEVNPITGEITWNTPSDWQAESFHVIIRAVNLDATDGMLEFILHYGKTAGDVVMVGPSHSYKTWQEAHPNLVSGQSIIIEDGSYSDFGMGIGRFNNGNWYPPSGTATALTCVMAETVGGVTLTGDAGVSFVLWSAGKSEAQDISFSGLFVKGGPSINFNGDSNDKLNTRVKRIKTIACGCDGDDAIPIYSRIADDILIESCYAFGGGRYKISTNESTRVVQRRNLGRMDRTDMDGVEDPKGTFMAYNTWEFYWSNLIDLDALDRFRSNGEIVGAFGTPVTGTGTTPEGSFGIITTCIHLNSENRLCNFDSQLSSAGGHSDVKMEHVASFNIKPDWAYGYSWGSGWFDRMSIVNIQPLAPVDSAMINTGGRYYCRGMTNSIIDQVDITTNGGTGDFFRELNTGPVDIPYNGGVSRTVEKYGVYGNNITNVDTAGMIGTGAQYEINTTTVDVSAAFDYLTRVNDDHALAGQKGAEVLYLKGKSGRFFGDAGYDEDTKIPMWPFPLQHKMAEKMREWTYTGPTYSGWDYTNRTVGASETADGNRGASAIGETITNYVWGALGKTVPPFNVKAVPEDGGCTIVWEKHAPISRDTITGYRIYDYSQVDGSLSNPRTISRDSHRHQITGLLNGFDATFVVTAIDSVKGESGYGYPVTVRPNGTPTVKPTITNVTGNLNLIEGTNFTLGAVVQGYETLSWLRNDVVISSVTEESYSSVAALVDDGAVYKIRAGNPVGITEVVISTLSVIAVDSTPPSVTIALNGDTLNIGLVDNLYQKADISLQLFADDTPVGNSFSGAVSSIDLLNENLPLGNLSLRVEATDPQNNTGTSSTVQYTVGSPIFTDDFTDASQWLAGISAVGNIGTVTETARTSSDVWTNTTGFTLKWKQKILDQMGDYVLFNMDIGIAVDGNRAGSVRLRFYKRSGSNSLASYTSRAGVATGFTDTFNAGNPTSDTGGNEPLIQYEATAIGTTFTLKADGVVILTETLPEDIGPFDGRIQFDPDTAGDIEISDIVAYGEEIPVNAAPTVDPQTVNVGVGQSRVITLGELTDSDGDTLVYSVTGSSDFVAGPGANEITFESASAGVHTLTVTADDQKGLSTSNTLTVIVSIPRPVSLKYAFSGWASMQNNLGGQNDGLDPSLYNLVGKMMTDNGILGYVSDFEYLPEGSPDIDGTVATAHANSTDSEVFIISAYPGSDGICADPATSSGAKGSGAAGWVQRVVDIATLAESNGMHPVLFQAWGNENAKADWGNAKLNTDAILGIKQIGVIRTAEILKAVYDDTASYATNVANGRTKYEPPVDTMWSGDISDTINGSYAMLYANALATMKYISGISAADNAYVVPAYYQMPAALVSLIKQKVDEIQVETMNVYIPVGVAPSANDINVNAYQGDSYAYDLEALTLISDDVAIIPANFTLSSATAAHYTSANIANGILTIVPGSSYEGLSPIIVTYTDADGNITPFNVNVNISAKPSSDAVKVWIDFGKGSGSAFGTDGNLYNHATALDGGGEVINLIRRMDALTTQGNLQDVNGVVVGSVSALTTDMYSPGYASQTDPIVVDYNPDSYFDGSLATIPKGTTVSFSINGLTPGDKFVVGIGGMYPYADATNVVDVNVNGVTGSYNSSRLSNLFSTWQDIVTVNADGKIIFALSQNSTADRGGLSYVTLEKQAGLPPATSNYSAGDQVINPNMPTAMPDKWVNVEDPTTGTRLTRVTDSSTDMQLSTQALNGSSRWSQENADGSLYIAFGSDLSSSTVLRKTTGAVVAYLASDDSGADASTLGLEHEVRWDKTGNHANRVYFRSGMSLYQIDDVTQNVNADRSNPTRSVIKDFSSLIDWPAGTEAFDKKIFNGQKGDSSLDSDHWAFMAAYNDGGTWRIRAIVHYQISTDTTHILYPSDLIGSSLDSTQATSDYFTRQPSAVGISPLATGIVVHVARSDTGVFEDLADTWLDGTHLWPLDLDWRASNPFKISISDTNSGWCWSADGREMFTYLDDRRDMLCATYISGAYKGYSLPNTAVPGQDPGVGTIDFARHIDLAYTEIHFSQMPQSKPGWVLLSTYDTSDEWADDQLMMFEVVDHNSSPNWWRVSPMYSKYSGQAFDEAPASMSLDGNSIYVSQNWGTSDGASNEVFRYDLPEDWQTTAPTTNSGVVYGEVIEITGVEVS